MSCASSGGAVCMQRAHLCSVECQLRSSFQWQRVHHSVPCVSETCWSSRALGAMFSKENPRRPNIPAINLLTMSPATIPRTPPLGFHTPQLDGIPNRNGDLCSAKLLAYLEELPCIPWRVKKNLKLFSRHPRKSTCFHFSSLSHISEEHPLIQVELSECDRI